MRNIEINQMEAVLAIIANIAAAGEAKKLNRQKGLTGARFGADLHRGKEQADRYLKYLKELKHVGK
ncbi:MAG: hypothetical protein LBB59_08145 [Campylobacteraceae bacterium]|jgi:hypothetical protein|nr:hypothetical protein [Campylobacteraceae bacterium]